MSIERLKERSPALDKENNAEPYQSEEQMTFAALVAKEREMQKRYPLKFADWFYLEKFTKEDKTFSEESKTPEIKQVYDYQTATGELLFQVVRQEPKSFKVRRPDGNGDWIWNKEGLPLVLYRLPEVLDAVKAGRAICITEGEKDCDNLRSLGLAATTAPFGAGSRWQEQYTNALSGAKQVVVLPDNDNEGKKHGLDIAQALYGKVDTLKIIELPGLDIKGDVSDWLKDGHTLEGLTKLVESTPDWIRPEQSSTLVQPRSVIAAPVTEAVRNQKLWKLIKPHLEKLTPIANGEFMCLCPFHSDSTPSCSINPEKGCFYCFGCGAKGTLFELAKKMKLELPIELGAEKYFGEDYRGHKCFQPVVLAREIMQQKRFISLVEEKVYHIYVYQKGIYVKGGYGVIGDAVTEKLDAEDRENRFRNVASHIERATRHDPEKFDADPNILNVRNGLLDLRTRELAPHSPDYLSFIQLPVEYNPDADCPKIKQFLSEVARSDELATIQEFLGYTLRRHTKYVKSAILVGASRGGKSTLLNLIISFLGRDNTASASLQSLSEDKFATADLEGKLANIYSDLARKPLTETGIFKALSTGDMLRVQKKFGQAHSATPYCKQIYSCNQLPKLKDNDDAFYQRWIILHFDHQFAPDNPRTDPYLLEKLGTSEELSGLLNWALEGLARLEANNGRFSYAPKAEDTQEEWNANADPIQAFCEAFDITETRETEDKVSSERLYQLYQQFCDSENIKVESSVWFGRSLKKHLHSITRGKMLDEYGERVGCYQGLRIG